MASDQDEDRNLDPIRLIVGGVTFMTTRATLQRYPNTRLADLKPSSVYFKNKMDAYFFDRNPQIFHHVLELYRTGKLHVSASVCFEAMLEELEFWNLDMRNVLAPCCLGAFQEYEEKCHVLQKVYKHMLEESIRDDRVRTKIESAEGARLFRYRLWMLLERPNSSTAALMWCLFQILLVYVCMIIYALMTSRHGTIGPYYNGTIEIADLDESPRQSVSTPYVIQLIDVVINSLFTADLLIRIAIAPDRLKFMKLVTTMVDVLCVVTYWVYAVFNAMDIFDGDEKISNGVLLARNAIFIIQVFRLVKLTKLSARFVQLRSLLLSLRDSLKEIFVMNLCFTAVMFLFAVVVYFCEDGQLGRMNGSGLSDIPAAFWWALITMTTVGYGDLVPTTTAGYFVGGLCALTGIILTGLAISILANNLTIYSQLTAQQNRAEKVARARKAKGGFHRLSSEKDRNGADDFQHVYTNGGATVLDLKSRNSLQTSNL